MSSKADKVIDSLASRILDLENCDNKDNFTRQFVDKMTNSNTQQQTTCHIRLFSKWLNVKSEMRAPEQIEAKQLDLYMAQFFLTIRKDGSCDINHASRQYEPSTLTAMHSSFFRYLNSKDYGHNIKTSELFRHSRDVMCSKMKELKQLGKGSKPNAAQPFSTDHIAMLYEQNLLGRENPKSILNSIWLYTTMHFGLRGRQEHVQMLWGDIELIIDNSGQEYLQFHERATKTRQGSSRETRAFLPKMFATGNADCPVLLYKEYARHRPLDYCEPDTRFYLTPIKKLKSGSDQWYTRQPLGKNAIGNIAKTMAIDGNLCSAKITNHSGRKTAVQTLLHAGIPPTDVMQLTGHKNVQSLNSYAHLSNTQQQSMSNVLSTQLESTHAVAGPSASISNFKLESAHAVAGPSASISNFNSLYGLDDSIISELAEPFNDQEHNAVTSQAYISTQSISKLIPVQYGARDFLNGTTIHGNISINFYSNPPKRRRVDTSLSIEESQDSEE